MAQPGAPCLSCHIIQLTKCPYSLPVKTRLAGRLNAGQRQALHTAMTERVCEQAIAAAVGPVTLAVAGDLQSPFCRQLTAQFAVALSAQGEGDLGQRMQGLLSTQLAATPRHGVILVGSDCPGITADDFQQAARLLTSKPVILTPALDGGYVLVGVRGAVPAPLFTDIPWGSEAVMAVTRQRLTEHQLAYGLLPPLADIDRPEDLALLAGLPSPLNDFARL